MVPSLFLAHGSPMLAMEDTEYTRFLGELGRTYRPRAIVIFSAHWETDTITVSAHDDVYETIYDFFGFPEELYQVVYPARGSNEVAELVVERLRQNGIHVKKDMVRGLDHGSWTLLSKMYPNADIPVVQVSVNPLLSPAEQVRIGAALRGFGDEGILVIGSGVTVHNLRLVDWHATNPESWAVEFDDWLIEKLVDRDVEALLRYETLAPHAMKAVPTREHFVPLLLALGCGDSERGGKVMYRGYDFGTLSYLCMEF